MQNRGVRRIAEKRIKARMRDYIVKRNDMCKKAFEVLEEPTDKMIGRQASVHGVGCSCHGCGNPRKHYKGKGKLTRQEVLEIDRENDQVE
jgi:hypothetical protein